jgi:hypothetical protein
MIESWTLLVSICVGLVAYVGLRLISNDSKRPPLPPGPKGLPLLGNLNDLPPPGVVEAFHWLKHKELYGAILEPNLILGKLRLIVNN